MSNVLILGANGQVARDAIDLFLKETDARLTLYLRNSRRLRNPDPDRDRVIEGDVLDTSRLKEAMAGQDVVYANLAGDLERQARSIVKAMDETLDGHLRRGSGREARKHPGSIPEVSQDHRGLGPRLHDPETRMVHRGGRDRLRDDPEGRTLQRSVVSRKSVAALVVKLAESPELEVRRNLGVSKPV